MSKRGWMLTIFESLSLAVCLAIAEHFGALIAMVPTVMVAMIYYFDGKNGWSL